MKKYILPTLLLATSFAACNEDLLEIDQKGVVTTETFYQNDEDAEAAMVAAYQGFLWNICTKEGGSIYAPMRACFNLCGDDIYGAGEFFGDNDFMAAMNEFRYDTGSEVIRNCYSNIYYAMYYSNLVIDKFTRDGATPVMKRCVAEARVLRAYMHMMLAIGWDCPPLIDHVVLPTETVTNSADHNELLKWCATECDKALADLEERQSPLDKAGAVKVTKGFANAVAGKALLFAGDYSGAKSHLKAVIDSKKYKLVDGDRYWENFHIEGDANEEKIFEANLQLNPSVGVFWDIVNRSTWMEANIWNWRSDHYLVNPSAKYSGVDGWGGLGVPQAFADDFVENDGEDSYRLKATIVPFEDVVFGTLAGLGVDKYDNMTYDEKLSSNEIGLKSNGLYGQSFWLPLKPVCRIADCASPGTNVRVNNYTIMRYAEVLLMYAEACVQTNSASDALTYINEIQNRAHSKTISTSVDMNVIEKEKKFELWLEGCRWPDMVRWGKLDGAKKAGQSVPQLYDKLTRAPEAGEKITWHPDGRFYMVETHVALDKGFKCGFEAGKHEHFPFPENVVSINPALKQNPGW